MKTSFSESNLLQDMAFFHRIGIVLNNQLPWDDKETNNKTIVVNPVEKDRMETKL